MRFRDYKENSQGCLYHIYNRGNRGENIFLDEDDYRFFILRLRQNLYPSVEKPRWMQCLPDDSFSLSCYCLLPNHFHLLIRQNKDLPISKLLLRICTSYSIYFNKKYKKIGHIFQDQFKQKNIISDEYFKWLCAYINQNPRLHGLVNFAKDYKWSSYNEFLNISNPDRICDTSLALNLFDNNPIVFSEFVESNFYILKQNKEMREYAEGAPLH